MGKSQWAFFCLQRYLKLYAFSILLFVAFMFYVSIQYISVSRKKHLPSLPLLSNWKYGNLTYGKEFIKDSLKTFGSTSKNETYADGAISRNDETHVIVWFNPNNPEQLRDSLMPSQCEYKNCVLTSNKTNLREQSAIIFITAAAPMLPQKPPFSPTERRLDQAWIFFWQESPVHLIDDRIVFQNEYWRNTVNWTMTYTYDADIFAPYGSVHIREPPEKNYSQIYHNKAKLAVWIVSNCHAKSQREKYVDELRNYGVDVDVFGSCGGKRLDGDTIRKKIDLEYKLYFSFENSLCKDYITEKFFTYFDMDVVLVVRGGGNYSKLVPNNTIINTAKFSNVRNLAQYLLSVASSEERYTNYLRNKDKFTTDGNLHMSPFCSLCEKLNNLDKYRSHYTDLISKIHNGTCSNPTDI